MKPTKTSMVLSLLLLGFSLPALAQDTLPTVMVSSIRYKYLTAVGQKDVPPPVKMLQQKVAEYNIKDADFYQDEYESYFVAFYIPDGEILAVYDPDGKILRTVEKYKNSLSKNVRDAVSAKYPNWSISKDVYLVYYMADNNAKKVYKLTLQNGDKRMKVKLNENGEFI